MLATIEKRTRPIAHQILPPTACLPAGLLCSTEDHAGKAALAVLVFLRGDMEKSVEYLLNYKISRLTLDGVSLVRFLRADPYKFAAYFFSSSTIGGSLRYLPTLMAFC